MNITVSSTKAVLILCITLIMGMILLLVLIFYKPEFLLRVLETLQPAGATTEPHGDAREVVVHDTIYIRETAPAVMAAPPPVVPEPVAAPAPPPRDEAIASSPVTRHTYRAALYFTRLARDKGHCYKARNCEQQVDVLMEKTDQGTFSGMFYCPAPGNIRKRAVLTVTASAPSDVSYRIRYMDSPPEQKVYSGHLVQTHADTLKGPVHLCRDKFAASEETRPCGELILFRHVENTGALVRGTAARLPPEF